MAFMSVVNLRINGHKYCGHKLILLKVSETYYIYVENYECAQIFAFHATRIMQVIKCIVGW